MTRPRHYSSSEYWIVISSHVMSGEGARSVGCIHQVSSVSWWSVCWSACVLESSRWSLSCAVFTPSDGTWYVLSIRTNTIHCWICNVSLLPSTDCRRLSFVLHCTPFKYEIIIMYYYFGPGNGSPMATNVVVVVGFLVVIRFFDSLRLCRFSTDRDET